MERAKKMVLIPRETAERLLRHKQTHTGATSNSDPASRLDRGMNDVLNTNGKSDREKWKLYRSVLRRYLFYAAESRKPLTIDIRGVGEASTGKTTSRVGNNDEDDCGSKDIPADEVAAGDGTLPSEDDAHDNRTDIETVVVSVPPKYRSKADKLLRYLVGKAKEDLTWDADGKVSIAGTPLDGTNIIDLINDVMRERKTVQAVGRRQFASLLHAVHTPREYIGNPAFWKPAKQATVRSKISSRIFRQRSRLSKTQPVGRTVVRHTDSEEEGVSEEDDLILLGTPSPAKTQSGNGRWCSMRLNKTRK